MGLDIRKKELIAVGASVAAHCQPCLMYHVEKAREQGADPQEIEEAIEVGRMVGNGAARNMKEFAAQLIAEAPRPQAAAQPGCGCAT